MPAHHRALVVAAVTLGLLATGVPAPAGATPTDSDSISTPDGASIGVLDLGLTQIALDFPAGTIGGTTAVTARATGPTVREFTPATDPPVYYDLDTTAVPGAAVTVCITFEPGIQPAPDTQPTPDPQPTPSTRPTPGAPDLYRYADAGYGLYEWSNITTLRSTGLVCGETLELSEFVLGFPLDDGSAAKPAMARLRVDTRADNWPNDGDFNVVMTLRQGENANVVRLLENDVVIDERSLVLDTPNAQVATFAVTKRPNGAYVYVAELENSRGVTATDPITVLVTDALPAEPQLSATTPRRGDFVVTATLSRGTNASTYRFFENGIEVASGDLNAATPHPQSATLEVTDKPRGSYVYTVTFANFAGETESAPLRVRVP